MVNKTHGFNQRLTYKMSLQFFALLYDRASYNFNISYWVVKWTEVVDITKIIEDMTFCSHCENRTKSKVIALKGEIKYFNMHHLSLTNATQVILFR